MHLCIHMPNDDEKVRVNGRVPKELYGNICQYYDNMTQAINEALELLHTSKNGTLHKDCGKNMQNDASSCKEQVDILKQQLSILVEQLATKDNQLEKQAFHIQTLIQENSKLNLKLLPEKTEHKKLWWKFW